MNNHYKNRIAMGIEYDGSQFHGWQRQRDVLSVQGALEMALSKVAATPVEVVAAGRTDRGVHARGQVIHFDTEAQRSVHAWTFGTNTFVHRSIRILWAKEVPPHFDARRSATGRRYRYVIYNHRIRPSLFRNHVAWYYRELDIQWMQEAVQYWIGEHDFSSFRAADCQSHSPIRNVTEISIKQPNNSRHSPNSHYSHCNTSSNVNSNVNCNTSCNASCYIMVDITANAFLHHMVRNMMGVLLEIGSGRAQPMWAKEVLEAKDRKAAANTSDAKGLYLAQVFYPDVFQLPEKIEEEWFV